MPSAQQSQTKSGSKQKPKKMMDAEDVMILEMQEIYSAEKQLSRALPRLTKVIQTESVKEAMNQRLEQGERLLQGLDQCFEILESSPGRKKNVVAEALIADAQEHIEEMEKGPALDAVLIGAIQKTEHYCIAAWGTTRAMADSLGEQEVSQLMQKALDEGSQLDEQLTQCAQEEVIPALEAMDEEDSDDDAVSAMDDEEPTQAMQGQQSGRSSNGSSSRSGGSSGGGQRKKPS